MLSRNRNQSLSDSLTAQNYKVDYPTSEGALPPSPELEILMIFRRPLLASLIACAALSLPKPARAEPSSAEISAAKHAFEEALVAEGDQRWADAAQNLRQAIAVKDTPGLRFHLARCEAELGRLVEAALEYDRAEELIAHGVKAPDVQKLLGPARSDLQRRLPRLTLEVPADVQVPLITVDRQPYPASELALGLPLNPGLHQVRVQAAGRRPFERALNLKEGDRIALSAVLPVAAPPGGPSDANATPDPPPSVNPSSSEAPRTENKPSSSVKLYLMIGESVLTVAGLGVGIGYAVARGSATDRANAAMAQLELAAPGNPTACASQDQNVADLCSDLTTALHDHDRAAHLSQVGFITAGVGAVALVTTWLVYPSPRPRTSGFSVLPVAGLGRLGVVGRF